MGVKLGIALLKSNLACPVKWSIPLLHATQIFLGVHKEMLTEVIIVVKPGGIYVDYVMRCCAAGSNNR